MKFLVIAMLALAALVFVVALPRTEEAAASTPGSVAAPLISCPNVDGSTEASADPDKLGTVTVSDILKVVQVFFKDAPAPSSPGATDGFPYVIDSDYVFLYDRNANGELRVDDILNVVQAFFQECPRVDTEVARATQWILTEHPELIVEDPTDLAAAGYYRGSNDVPGQGIHYTNLENWDGTFDPRAPEGLVYHGGILAAQLYVTDGNAVGWGTHDVNGAWPPPTTPHDVDLETDADGPQCGASTPCSWDGSYDGWHLHYYLCTINIGTTSALAIPGILYPGGIKDWDDCNSVAPGSQPECTIPIATTPCFRWGDNIGWMGHLWNWLPNTNQVPDLGGNNGRFADCMRDVEGWKSFNCPA